LPTGGGAPAISRKTERGLPEYDGAGEATTTAFDFKGFPTQEQRQLVEDPKETPDWTDLLEEDSLTDVTTAAPLLDVETFAACTRDALGRVLTAVSPNGSEVHYAYDEGGGLQQVSHRGGRGRHRRLGANMAGKEPFPYFIRRRALALRNLGEVTAAKELLLTCLPDCENEPLFWAMLGTIEKASGDLWSATGSFQRAVDLDPENELLSRGLFHVYWKLAQEGDATAESCAALELERFLSLANSDWHEGILKDVLWLLNNDEVRKPDDET
jgi:YD repeat-containing protein